MPSSHRLLFILALVRYILFETKNWGDKKKVLEAWLKGFNISNGVLWLLQAFVQSEAFSILNCITQGMDQTTDGKDVADGRDIELEGGIDGNDINRYWSEISEKNMTYEEPLLKKRVNTTSQIAIIGANISPIESLDYE